MDLLSSTGFFSRVLIDECTQAYEPATLVSLGRSAEQVVLVGDQKQLPATVLSQDAKNGGLGESLFERMIANGVKPTLLVEQRRMHSSISEFPNRVFYNNALVNAIEDTSLETVPGFPWPNPDIRVAFVDVSQGPYGGGLEMRRGYSVYNTAEANAIADKVEGMLNA